MDALKLIAQDSLKAEKPAFSIGDTVRVDVKIREGERERVQAFEGTVIAINGSGVTETFTVRRISYGVAVEKTFPVHSPNVEKVEIIRSGKVRRAKLYYLRDRIGKASKPKRTVSFRCGRSWNTVWIPRFWHSLATSSCRVTTTLWINRSSVTSRILVIKGFP